MAALGKRTRSAAASSATSSPSKTHLAVDTASTPASKRPRISPTPSPEDPTANKENIPPLVVSPMSANSHDVAVEGQVPSARLTRSRSRGDASTISNPTLATPTTLNRIRRPQISRGRTSQPLQRSSSVSDTPPLTPSSDATVDSPLLTPSLDLSRIHLDDNAAHSSKHNKADHALSPSVAYSLARSALKTSDPIGPLVGRDAEQEAVRAFIAPLQASSSFDKNILYISGTPGTGKTAVVRSILAEAGKEDVQVGLVNCMGLTTARAVYEACWTALRGSVKVKDAKSALEELFAKGDTRFVLALDEVDSLLPLPSVLASILQLPETYRGVLCLLTIANSLTFPSHLPSMPSLRHMTFAAYTSQQMKAIVHSKLDGTSTRTLLDVSGLEFAARRVGGSTGDLRVLVDVLKKALDEAEREWHKASAENPFIACDPVKVSPTHILNALKTTCTPTSSATSNISNQRISSIRSLTVHSRLILLSMLVADHRASLSLPGLASSASNIKSIASSQPSPDQLYSSYSFLLTRYGSSLPQGISSSDFKDTLNMLESQSILCVVASTGPRKKALPDRSVRLTASVDEVRRGLGLEDDQESADGPEKELKTVWSRACKDARMEATRRGHQKQECPVEERL